MFYLHNCLVEWLDLLIRTERTENASSSERQWGPRVSGIILDSESMVSYTNCVTFILRR